MNTFKITVTIKNNYGTETIYPHCAQAKTFASMLGQKTLTRDNLKHILALGFSVEQHTPTLNFLKSEA